MPITCWTGKPPDLNMFRVFGCPAVVAQPAGTVPKGAPRGRMAIYVGNNEESRGWLLFTPDTKRVIVSMHVSFDELWMSMTRERLDAELKAVAPALQSDTPERFPGRQKEVRWAQDMEPAPQSGELPSEMTKGWNHLEEQGAVSSFGIDAQGEPRSSARVKARGSIAQTALVQSGGASAASPTSPPTFGLDPKSVKEALDRPDAALWRAAMDAEWLGPQQKNTFELVNLPAGRKAVGTVWVFKEKKDQDGKTEKHKARLCLRGFSMQQGVDYFATYAPTVHVPHLRLLLALSAIHGWDLYTWDVEQAYVNAREENEVYVKQPHGFDDGSGMVLQALRCLYGGPAAGRQWHEMLHGLITSLGFTQSANDKCVYMLKDTDGSLAFILAIHVDDITGAGPGGDKVATAFTEMMRRSVKCTAVKNPPLILGMKVQRDPGGKKITISQSAHVSDMLQRFGFEACSPRRIPIEPGTVFSKRDSPPEADPTRRTEYMSKVGSLLYVATQGTRPDIAQATCSATRVMQNPAPMHLTYVNNIFKYLAKQPERGITYDGDAHPNVELVCFADSSFADQPHEMETADACKSTTGVAIMLAGALVCWKSRLQKHVATSTGGAEMHAAYECGVEAAGLAELPGGAGLQAGPHQDIRGLHRLHLHGDVRHHLRRAQGSQSEVPLGAGAGAR